MEKKLSKMWKDWLFGYEGHQKYAAAAKDILNSMHILDGQILYPAF